jgi:hypothetical protein
VRADAGLRALDRRDGGVRERPRVEVETRAERVGEHRELRILERAAARQAAEHLGEVRRVERTDDLREDGGAAAGHGVGELVLLRGERPAEHVRRDGGRVRGARAAARVAARQAGLGERTGRDERDRREAGGEQARRHVVVLGCEGDDVGREHEQQRTQLRARHAAPQHDLPDALRVQVEQRRAVARIVLEHGMRAVVEAARTDAERDRLVRGEQAGQRVVERRGERLDPVRRRPVGAPHEAHEHRERALEVALEDARSRLLPGPGLHGPSIAAAARVRCARCRRVGTVTAGGRRPE